MKAQIRQLNTPHSSVQAPFNLADVIEEVSRLAASPDEAALVIERMFRRRKIRFADDFDARRLAL